MDVKSVCYESHKRKVCGRMGMRGLDRYYYHINKNQGMM